MDEQKKDTIEFELDLDDTEDDEWSRLSPEVKDFVRSCFRVPIEDGDPVRVFVDEAEYTPFDLSEGGVGFYIPLDASLTTGEKVRSLKLIVEGMEMVLSGKIAHVSKLTSTQFISGIEFLDINKEQQEHISKYVEKHRKDIFNRED